MKKLLFSILLGFLCLTSIQANQKFQDYARKFRKVNTAPNTSFNLQELYPSCTVTVYQTGTTNLATIYSDNSNTLKSNPFTASSDASFSFYAEDGRYDIKFSGTGITTPFTWSDILLVDNLGTSSNISLNQYQFGAYCNGTSHTITNSDITAHPEWLGTYTSGTEWDTVAIQETIYAAYGTGTPRRWASREEWKNRKIEFGNGKCLINKNIKVLNVVGISFHGAGRKATSFVWTGSNPNEAMFSFNNIAYGEIGDFSLDTSSTNNVALLDIDSDLSITDTLRQQQLTLKNIDFGGNGAAEIGHRWNWTAFSSGQGDTILISNVSEFGFKRAGAWMGGANMLQITVLNGDSQGNKYGYELHGAQVHFIDKHFENGGPEQIEKNGFDILQEPGALDGSESSIENSRSESARFVYSTGPFEISKSRSVAANGFQGSWQANASYRQGNIIYGGGKYWINVTNEPTLDAAIDIVSPFSSTAISVSGTPWIAGAEIGNFAKVIFPNCFEVIAGPITANTTSTLTITLPFPPGDGVGQPCGTASKVQVYNGAFPKTAASEPTWGSVGSVYYQSGINGSDPGVATASGSNIVTGSFGAWNSAFIGSNVLVSNAGTGTNNWLYATIIGVPTSNTLELDKNATITNILNPSNGEFGTQIRIQHPTSGGYVLDGTVKWLQYEFYSVAGANFTIYKSSFVGGKIWGFGDFSVEKSKFTRSDWAHNRLYILGDGFTDHQNTPSAFGNTSLAKASILNRHGIGFGNGYTFAEITAMADVQNLVSVGCNNCTHGSNPCTGSGTGAIAKRLNGVWVCN